ncbi:MAG: aminotransferase class V-fold PLP-dependent enzyme, partial [Microthrixaceae bacterium]
MSDLPPPPALPTGQLGAMRASEFSHLDEGGHRYFDYTGAGIAARSQIDAAHELIVTHVLGNPHSQNPTSAPATDLVEEARRAVLEYFGATEHVCIFTPNASAALRLVGESFPFAPDRPFALSADNHNSVNGIREFARHRGAPVSVLPLVTPELRLDIDAARSVIEHPPARRAGLFAFPAQSNYSGVQHPLGLVDEAGAAGWRVLLDTAAFVPTNRLDLGAVRADFACVSFYKMFGFPTGVGALIARHDALAELSRPWFAGGTISMVSVSADAHRLVPGHVGFEDGTLNFASIPAVRDGLELVGRVGIESIHERVLSATRYLLGSFAELRHGNGEPLVKVLGPSDPQCEGRGGTIAFNLYDPHGTMIHDRAVTDAASREGISLRSGCFCNPGCGEAARGLGATDMAPFFQRADPPDFCDLDDAMWELHGWGASALRASVGWATDEADLMALLRFLAGFRDRRADSFATPDERPET